MTKVRTISKIKKKWLTKKMIDKIKTLKKKHFDK